MAENLLHVRIRKTTRPSSSYSSPRTCYHSRRSNCTILSVDSSIPGCSSSSQNPKPASTGRERYGAVTEVTRNWTLPMRSRSRRDRHLTVFRLDSGGSTCQEGRVRVDENALVVQHHCPETTRIRSDLRSHERPN